MQIRRLLRTSAHLLRSQWKRTIATSATFFISLGTFALFLGVTTAAAKHLMSVLEQRGALNVLTVTGARVTRMGARDVELTNFRSLRIADAEAIAEQLGSRAIVAPIHSTPATVRFRDRRKTTDVTGTTPSYFSTGSTALGRGRLWSAADARRPVAVLGFDLANDLFGYEDPIGKRIRIGQREFLVTGVLRRNDDPDVRAIVPLRHFSATDQISAIVARVVRDGDRAAAAAEIARVLRARHRIPPSAEDDFSIRDERSLIEAQEQIGELFRVVLPAISLVSLVAGGIGIFTVMLLAIRERAAEIGLRRAIGASRSAVLMQFVLEALLLIAPSAAAGEIFGTLLAALIAHRSGWPVSSVYWQTLVLAFAGAIAFGTLCSIIPARRAANLDPAAALRA